MFGLSIFKRSDRKKIGAESGLAGSSSREIVALACGKSLRTEIVLLGKTGSRNSVFAGYEEDLNSFFVPSANFGADLSSMTPHKTVARFYFNLNGSRRRFRSMFLGTMKWNGATALRFEVPETIEEIQRREYFRVRPSAKKPVRISVMRGGLEVNMAIDISAGGLSFASGKQLRSGDRLPISLQLPGGELSFASIVETRGYEIIEGQNRRQKPATRTGAYLGRVSVKPYKLRTQFLDLNLGEKQLIERYVVERQRELLRYKA